MAATQVSYKIEGLEELKVDFGTLTMTMQRQAVAAGLRAMGNTIAKEMKRRAPKGVTGNLRKGIKYVLTSPTRNPVLRVGTFVPAYHGHLVEFGTRAHAIPHSYRAGRLIRHPGARPRPFLYISVKATQGEALRKCVSAVRGVTAKLKLKMLKQVK